MSPQRPPKPRPKPEFSYIQQLHQLGFERIIGLDEVGRGALAGPLVVAAVELQEPIEYIADSKELTGKVRVELLNKIYHQSSLISLGMVSNLEIDQLGLAKAQALAYQRCLKDTKADLYLTDNVKLDNKNYLRSIKADQLFFPVAAASIVAKVYRDQLMSVYHQFHPLYNWHKNVGYGTKQHLEAVHRYGLSPLHRKSFIKK